MSMKIICKQCHREFEFTESEIQFYKSKGLSLPKRCKNCRQQNKEKKLNQGITVIQKDKPSVPIWIFIIVILIFIAIITGFVQNQKHRSKSSVLSKEISIADETETTAILETETTKETTVPLTETTRETTVLSTETKKETAPHTEKPEVTYVLNTYRKKFHKPTCASVSEMNSKNREYFYGTRDEAVAQGYSPCGNCKP